MREYFRQPDIDPVIFKIGGPFQVRWYSVFYVGAFVVARFILRHLAKEKRFKFTPDHMEQFILWALLGAVIGSRIIYCVVYDPQALLANPLYLFQVYKGGLAFHGGLLGVIVAAIIFSRKYDIPFWNLADAMALATPHGLAMGRLGNFINGELYGRVSNVPWAVIFKDGGNVPRHPSQLYEMFLEGILLFIILWCLKGKLKRDGDIATAFVIGYSGFRFIAEFFRQPDAHLGFVLMGLSMGQLLCLLMFFGGLGILFFRRGVRTAS